MIQADEGLLERARREAGERGVTFPQFVREALEHELGSLRSSGQLACAGVISTGGRARRRRYKPDPWR